MFGVKLRCPSGHCSAVKCYNYTGWKTQDRTMLAMRYTGDGARLFATEVPCPTPAAGQLLLEVRACGVCRTDLHIVDGELPQVRCPVTPGHEIVGRVVATGTGTRRFSVGDRVGVPWLASTCGHCAYCRGGRENLCTAA